MSTKRKASSRDRGGKRRAWLGLVALTVFCTTAAGALAQDEIGGLPSEQPLPLAGMPITVHTVVGSDKESFGLLKICGKEKWSTSYDIPATYVTSPDGKSWLVTIKDSDFNANAAPEEYKGCGGLDDVTIKLKAANKNGQTIAKINKPSTKPAGLVTVDSFISGAGTEIKAKAKNKKGVWEEGTCWTKPNSTLKLTSGKSNSKLKPQLVGRHYKQISADRGNAVLVTMAYRAPAVKYVSGYDGVCTRINAQYGNRLDMIGLSWEIDVLPALL